MAAVLRRVYELAEEDDWVNYFYQLSDDELRWWALCFWVIGAEQDRRHAQRVRRELQQVVENNNNINPNRLIH